MEEKSSKNTRMTHYQGPIVIAIDKKTIQSLSAKSLETRLTLLKISALKVKPRTFDPNQSPECPE